MLSILSKLNASLSCSRNISMVSPRRRCCGFSFSRAVSAVLFHFMMCSFVPNSSKLKNSCAMSNAPATSFSSISSPCRLLCMASRWNAFFTRSICANGLGMAVRGFCDSPPFGSAIISISSAEYWLLSSIHPSPVVLLL